jgi:hypothetical protein
LTIKASAVLAIAAIWIATIAGIAADSGAWWSVFFAMLATAAVGSGFWRSLGWSRLIAIAGVWAATAIAFGNDSGVTWMSIFAAFSTFAIVHSRMRMTAFLNGLAAVVPWAIASALTFIDSGAAWTCVFAFFTVGSVANGGMFRALVSMAAWGGLGAIMIVQEDWYWLSILAFVATAIAFSSRPEVPRKFEWDLFESEDDRNVVEGRSRPLN